MKKENAIRQTGLIQTAGATRKLVVLSLLCAVGFVSMLYIKIPVIGFLSFEPKDVFLTLAGFLYGPLAALACSVVTGLMELTVSSTGLIGMIMNILSSAAFACTAALIYRTRRTLYSAAAGLTVSVAVMTAVMLLWNYLISPLYMHVTREEIVPLLTSMFLPFNLLKAGINAAVTLLLYRPFMRVLHLCGYPVSDHYDDRKSSNLVVFAVTAVLLCVCIGVVICLNRH